MARDWDELCKAEAVPELHGADVSPSFAGLCTAQQTARTLTARLHQDSCMPVACLPLACFGQPTSHHPALAAKPPAPLSQFCHKPNHSPGQVKHTKDADSDSGSAEAVGKGAEGVVGAGHPERTPAPLREFRKSRVSWVGLGCNQLVGRVGAAGGCSHCTVMNTVTSGRNRLCADTLWLTRSLPPTTPADLWRADQELQL